MKVWNWNGLLLSISTSIGYCSIYMVDLHITYLNEVFGITVFPHRITIIKMLRIRKFNTKFMVVNFSGKHKIHLLNKLCKSEIPSVMEFSKFVSSRNNHQNKMLSATG